MKNYEVDISYDRYKATEKIRSFKEAEEFVNELNSCGGLVKQMIPSLIIGEGPAKLWFFVPSKKHRLLPLGLVIREVESK